jgi:uncharacterized DUF497 family protein
MRLSYDAFKRMKTLHDRGLDFARANEVFDAPTLTAEDIRTDYGERRWVSIGYLDDRLVVVVWTERGRARRIISMRKANEREITKFVRTMGGSR